MSEPLPDLDLKFLPDWLKEGPAENRYAQFEGDRGERPGRGDRGGFGDRPRPERRGPRPGGPGGERRGPGNDRRGPGSGPGGRRDARGPQGPGGGRRPERSFSGPAAPAVPSAPVKIEFLPEPNGAAGIARQIKSSTRAYPLFGTARLFLERPERHRVRITSLDAAVPLYQIGDGPVSFDKSVVERDAFRNAREKFYSEETIKGEPPKGNFTKVARSRTTGALLGPTNHHAYQVGLRKLYEERFSRRMSFPEFLHQEIEIVADEAAVERWKEEASSTTTYTTTTEAEPLVFKSLSEAEQHFRKTYLPDLLKSNTTMECTGQASRSLTDRGLANAVRDAWEKERAFPAGLVNVLRPTLTSAGLHFFKHRKRILYISAIRPVRHAAGQVFSEGVAAILRVVEESPKCTRRDVAQKILGENHESPEVAPRKSALAADLHYLIYAGHVIEFHDGTLDLPLIPGAGAQPQQGQQKSSGRQSGRGAAANPAPSAELVAEGDSGAVSEDAESMVDAEAPLASEDVDAGGAATQSEVVGDMQTVPDATASVPVADGPQSSFGESALPLLGSAESLTSEVAETPLAAVVTDDALPTVLAVEGARDVKDPLAGEITAEAIPQVADTLENSDSDAGEAPLASAESLAAETTATLTAPLEDLVSEPSGAPVEVPKLTADTPTPNASST